MGLVINYSSDIILILSCGQYWSAVYVCMYVRSLCKVHVLYMLTLQHVAHMGLGRSIVLSALIL